MRNNTPYLTLVVCYHLPVIEEPSVSAETSPEPNRKDESWRDLLSEADMPLFNALRDWRNERCKQEGIPPYVIVTNRQLAEIVRLRPTSLAKLGEIEGVGKAKLERYGKDLVAVLSRKTRIVSPVTSHLSETASASDEATTSPEPVMPLAEPEPPSEAASHEPPAERTR